MAKHKPITSSTTVKITQEMVNTVTATDKPITLRDTTVKGLQLYIGKSEKKTWYIDYFNRDRKRQHFKIGLTDQYDLISARVKARTLFGSIASGTDPAAEKRKEKQENLEAKNRTLRAYLDGDYRNMYLSQQKAGEATRSRIKATWKPFLDDDMQKITTAHLLGHRNKRIADGISENTLNRDRAALYTLFEKAVKAGLIDKNPLNDEDIKPFTKADNKRVRYLGQRDEHEDIKDEEGNKLGERQRFLEALKKQPAYVEAMVGLAMNTGMRRGEIFSLRWKDIKLSGHPSIRVYASKTGTTHTLPLNSVAVGILTRWREQQKIVRINGLVFPSAVTGEVLTNIKRSWTTLRKDAQLTDFRFHDLRHDFASRLVMAGVSLYITCKLMRHGSITMTERYSHLAPEHLREAVEVLT